MKLKLYNKFVNRWNVYFKNGCYSFLLLFFQHFYKEPIAENYKVCVCPFIDVISYDTFEYRAQDEGARGAFDWQFFYKRLPLLPDDLAHPTRPFKSPVMAGGLFAMSAKFFWEVGGYDENLEIWGESTSYYIHWKFFGNFCYLNQWHNSVESGWIWWRIIWRWFKMCVRVFFFFVRWRTIWVKFQNLAMRWRNVWCALFACWPYLSRRWCSTTKRKKRRLFA